MSGNQRRRSILCFFLSFLDIIGVPVALPRRRRLELLRGGGGGEGEGEGGGGGEGGAEEGGGESFHQ